MKLFYTTLSLCALLTLCLTVSDDHLSMSFGDIHLPHTSFSIGKGFDIHYNFEKNNSITMGIIFRKPDNFFALGLGKTFYHEDVWLFKIIGNKVYVEDAYFIERFRPISDVELGGTEDLRLLGYQIKGDHVIVKINRALNTHDKYDQKLKSGGNMDFVWAFGGDLSRLSDEVAGDHFVMPLIKDDDTITRELEDYHALLHTIAWGFLVDVGILLLRYFRKNRPRFDFRIPHVMVMVPTALMSIIAIGLVIYKNWNFPRFGLFRGDLLVDAHMTLGLVFACYLPLLAAAGICTFLGVRIPHIREIHMTMGYIAYTLTKLNIVIGALFYAEGAWKVALLTYIGLVIMAHRSLSLMTEEKVATGGKKKLN